MTATNVAEAECTAQTELVCACLRELGPDPRKNMQRILAACGESLEASCVLYRRLEGQSLRLEEHWNALPDMATRTEARGQLCLEVIEGDRESPLLVRNLPGTCYAETDPCVRKHDLQTYLGIPVRLGSQAVGSLCVVFRHDFVPTALQGEMMVLVATILGVQEERLDVERMVRAGREQTRALMNALPFGVFIVDPETHLIHDANPAALSMIGAPREAVVDRLCHGFVCPAERGQCPITDLGQDVDHSKQVLLRADKAAVAVLKTVTKLQLNGRDMLLECVIDPSKAGSVDEEPPLAAADAMKNALAGRPILVVGRRTVELVDRLRTDGCNVQSSGHAADALHCMETAVEAAKPYDAVIIDDGLSGIDALLFAQLVREDDRFSSTRLVLLSQGPKGDFERHLAAGYLGPVGPTADAAALAALLETVPAASSPGAGAAAGETPPGDPVEGVSILLVEDNAINMEVAREMIHKMGYRCDHAADGYEAVEAMKRFAFDLVLMDCQMPGMDGYEATRHIRAMEQAGNGNHHVPIVAVTAHAMKGDRERCMAVGMDDYLTKPVDAGGLQATITKWLKRTPTSPPRGTAAGSETPLEV